MNRYLFLLAWVEGSDSAGGEETAVNYSEDLKPQFEAGNPHVFAVQVLASTQKAALTYGYAKAFHNNYTGHDSVSDIVKIKKKIPDVVQIRAV